MATSEHGQLTEAEIERIFRSSVLPVTFFNASPSPTPTLTLIGAQPGAGKTRAATAEFAGGRSRPVKIIGDDLRIHHPEYRSLLAQSPADMPAATAQASAAWVERAIEYAAENRISALVEGTFRNPEVTLGTAERFKRAGFNVTAVLVAVPPEVSHVSIAGRFVEDERKNGFARFTPLEAHERAFNAIPDTIRALAAADAPIDRIRVRTRDELIFDAVRHGSRAIRGVMQAAEAEWHRPMTAAERDRWAELADAVTEYLDEHHGDDADVRDLVTQLGLDRRYIDLSRSGEVAVRGHLRGGHPVEPYTRGRPTR